MVERACPLRWPHELNVFAFSFYNQRYMTAGSFKSYNLNSPKKYDILIPWTRAHMNAWAMLLWCRLRRLATQTFTISWNGKTFSSNTNMEGSIYNSFSSYFILWTMRDLILHKNKFSRIRAFKMSVKNRRSLLWTSFQRVVTPMDKPKNIYFSS